MQVLRSLFILFILGALSSSLAFSDEEVQDLKLLENSIEEPSLTQIVTYSNSRKKKNRRKDREKVYNRFSSTKSFQASKNVFFQTNVGIGFLYFSSLQGNLMGEPVVDFVTVSDWTTGPLKGRLSYNRTPLFEYLLGFRLNPWLQLALSYQNQGSIKVESQMVSGYSVNPSGYLKFSANLRLDALLAKAYLEIPFGIIVGRFSTNPYLAVGIGPGWQSWTRIQQNSVRGNSSLRSNILSFRQKISANAVWMIDMGLRMQNAAASNPFSIVMGCKYNQWGQARSMGKMSQQGHHKRALSKPVKIRTVYQFAPYLGVQWSFLPAPFIKKGSLKGKRTNIWHPYWVGSKEFQCPASIWTQFNAGVGFLYFSGLQGNLMGSPAINFNLPILWRDCPLKGRLSYNRTPLFEYLLGYTFNSWLKLAFSYQHQGDVLIQSEALSAYPNNTPPTQYSYTERIQFLSNLSLDAILAKVYLELPYSMIWKSLSVNPYLAVGVGPGWQSWTQVQITYMAGNPDFNANFFGNPLDLRQKISANAVWMIDMGLSVQSAYPKNTFSVYMGCKYNQWGKSNNIGKMSQQGAHKIALSQPVSIKTVYQFAPYLGAQWNFSPDQASKKSYRLREKRLNVWLPHWVASKVFQRPTSIWTQFNAGIGFLYFSGLRGNLMGRPVVNLTPATQYRDAPLKGRFSHNPTPLFEYLVGYRFNSWLKLALSYQHQTGVAVQSKAMLAFPNNTPPAPVSYSEVVQFTSYLSLDAVLAKVYFELPFAMIWRSLSANPYLAVGVGPGWQSWGLVKLNYMRGNDDFYAVPVIMRQKISANAVWMLDMGLRMQSAYPNSKFSVLVGCKYNQWGQARSIGKMSQQGSYKFSLTQPIRIKMVYQFAPYLGVQWNF